ncbi:ADP-ribosylation factor-like protein 16 isoform X1 [Bombina bombina]|uniref:ADP-ribosylation factor-like protein 16 isoform X1 n=1 Tax=Bombina bombina TaxID=8345 RepID=UPI00235B15E0|nr:ADP-ribosylation factor-like protein 16 isoform X1 [Bombina bombina]
MCLLLGAPGVGKTLLMKRLQKLNSREQADLTDVPPTLSTVGTNLTDLTFQRKRVTMREVGGSMGPIWPSYYKDCRRVLFLVDAANPCQVSSSCIQLLSVLSDPDLAAASVLVIFNKRDLPCCMSLVELKSLFRMEEIISCSTQPITVLETSARDGTGLREVLQWLHSSHGH